MTQKFNFTFKSADEILSLASDFKNTLIKSGKFDNQSVLDMVIVQLFCVYADMNGNTNEIKAIFEQCLQQFDGWGIRFGQ